MRNTMIVFASASSCVMSTAFRNQLQAFEEAETKYLLSMTPSGVPELGAINKARSIASDVRQMTKEQS